MEIENYTDYHAGMAEALYYAQFEVRGLIAEVDKLDPCGQDSGLCGLRKRIGVTLERITAKLEDEQQALRIAEVSGADMYDEADTIPSWNDGNYPSAEAVKREIEGAQYITYGPVKTWDKD